MGRRLASFGLVLFGLVLFVAGCLEVRPTAPCVVDADCAFDRICISQQCQDPPEGQPCVEDCEEPPPPPPPPGPCTDHSDCAFGERCVAETGICIDASRIGACTNDTECAPPTTVCDLEVGRCVDGCNDDPCLVGFYCDATTGHCLEQPTCGRDRFEPNDAASSASTPGALESDLRACIGDDDYFGVALEAGDHADVRVDFDPAEGRVGLDVVGTMAAQSSMPGWASVSFDADAGATYPVRVKLLEDLGAVLGTAYSIAVDVQIAPCVADANEDDDVPASSGPLVMGAPVAATACEADDDYFVLTATTDDEITVALDFVNEEGNIDVELIDPSGTVVAQGTSSSDDENLMHTAAVDGEYFVRVFLTRDGGKKSGAPYSLTVSKATPLRCLADSFEPNDQMSAPSLIQPGAQTSLAVCPGDDDYYAIDIAPGQTLDASVTFAHAEGDIDIELHNAAGTELISSVTNTDNESFSIQSGPGGTYTVRVYLYEDTGVVPGNPYDLSLTLR